MDSRDPRRRADAPSPLIGRTIAGRFKIGALIGEGGMATVYRGTQDGDPPDIAVKVMNAHLAADSTFAKRFSREAKAAARLKHRSTVQIVDYGVDDGLPYIVMELCEGAELVRILQHERRLPEARAARIMAQVCSALGAAHDLGIVHRDLKPENIMVMRDPKDPSIERVKVLDFGIAKIMERDMRPADPLTVDGDDEAPASSKSALTLAGTVVGTPEYMSPEQSRGAAVDARSDLYACGVLLYQMVTGRVPFSGDTYFETALMHVRDAPIPPRALTPSINSRLEALIMKALAKTPEERPDNARAMQEALLDMIPDLSTVRHLSGPPPPRKPLESRPRAPEPAAGRPPEVAPISVSTSSPDSDDARTRVLPVARELSGPISSEPPTLARPPTISEPDPPTLARPPRMDSDPPTVARPPTAMEASVQMMRAPGPPPQQVIVEGPTTSAMPRRRSGGHSAALSLALGIGLGAAIIAIAVVIAMLGRGH